VTIGIILELPKVPVGVPVDGIVLADIVPKSNLPVVELYFNTLPPSADVTPITSTSVSSLS